MADQKFAPFAPQEIFEQILEWAVIPTFDLVIEYGEEGLILVKRKLAPYQHQWALPGLRMLKNEVMEDTLRRIARQELGLTIAPLRKEFLGQLVGKFKTEHHRQDLSTGYCIRIPSSQKISLNQDHFSDLKLIKSKEEIPPNIGAMYKFYVEKYFSTKSRTKQYNYEGKNFDYSFLRAEPLSLSKYSKVHLALPIPCHDVVIEYNGGLLLIERDQQPLKGELCFIGGRLERGLAIIDSLRKKVKAECGLELYDIRELGTARTFFKTDPFGHGKGTDTINWVFFARGKGEIKLDKLHKNPVIIQPHDYTKQFRKMVHPYVRDFMDDGMKQIQNH